ncbi:MAG TPA: mechanosensitive ion channel domain-containing protein [Gammaproteobacteria bacterium]
MSDFLSMQRLLELVDLLYAWLAANVLVAGNAVQLLFLLASLGAALLAARKLAAWLERYRGHKVAGRVVALGLPLLLPLVWLAFQWLAIAVAIRLAWPHNLLDISASLVTAWVVIRFVSQLVVHPLWSAVITWTVWTIAALNILNLIDPAIALLDSVAITIGNLRISLYTVVKSTFALAVLLWLATYLTDVLETRIRTSRALSPSVQVLFVKSLKIVLVTVAVLLAIQSVGINLTALAVVGGAIGLGIGFGLQKVISNLVSGLVLLLDKSIKPGDIIGVEGTYGWVTSLGARYVSVVTRDGVEHLIPNDVLITERVENWTHTSTETRLKVPLRVHYDTDLPKAIELCERAAAETERVLARPEPRCLLLGFGESAIDLELRIWIADAQNGVQNVKSAVLLRIWKLFREHSIEVPYPQRDLHLRGPGELVSALRTSVA